MKIKLNIFWNWIKSHKIWSAVILIVLLVIAYKIFWSGSKASEIVSVSAEIGNLREEVSVTGNVKPLSDVDLAFERGGRVAGLFVAVGDRVYAGQSLASVSNADLLANVNQAKANLKKVQAGLGDNADKTALDFIQTKNSLMNSIRDSYTKADDALRNKVYSLFNDPSRYNSSLSFTTNAFLQEDIEEGKDDLGEDLDSWYRSLGKLNTSSDLELYYNQAQANLLSLKNLLNKCAEAVNGLGTEDGNTQTQIDTWKLNISTARTNVNTAIDSLTSAYNQYKSADLAIKISQNDTLAEEAGVEAAEAAVASAEAELAKTIIRSPISGVVTSVEAKLGEIIPANQKAISVISYGDYQIESFIPEADISKIKIGNKAKTTLDAYGDGVIFETQVIEIDPAATVIDGVPTYKVTLEFVDKDERIKSGMTANLDILTAEKNEVLIIPARAVFTKTDGKYVRVLKGEKEEQEIKVEVGLRGSDGMVEIISGLNKGDKVITSL